MTLWMVRNLATDLGLALLHSLWQVALLATALWALLTLLHRASPRLRHGLALGALALSIAWPGATLLQIRNQRQQAQRAIVVGLEARAAYNTSVSRPATYQGNLHLLRPALPFLAGAWGLGVLLLGVRLFGGWLWLSELRRQTSAAPAWVQDQAARLASDLGIRLPELRISEALGPLSYGLFRTVVVLPAACLVQLDVRELEAILAHEFAHLQRLDFVLNGLQSIADVLLFHHPLARWISAIARLERERCCDETAAFLCGDARTVAAALNHLDDLRPPTLALAAQGAPLMIRIQYLLGRTFRPSLATSFSAALVLGGLALAAAAPMLQTVPAAPILAPAELIEMADAAAIAEGLDPYLVRSMIQCESRFNPAAVSSMGSIGLLQVMPQTAARFGVTRLTDPRENLKAGTKYLRFLLDRYHGDKAKAVIAYNSGEEALDRTHGIPPTEESRSYALAVMDLYQHKGVEAAAPGTLLGELSSGKDGSITLKLGGSVRGNLELIVTQDVEGSTVTVCSIRNGKAPEDLITPHETNPKIVFQPKAPGLPIRIKALAGGHTAELAVPLSPLPQAFTLSLGI